MRVISGTAVYENIKGMVLVREVRITVACRLIQFM